MTKKCRVEKTESDFVLFEDSWIGHNDVILRDGMLFRVTSCLCVKPDIMIGTKSLCTLEVIGSPGSWGKKIDIKVGDDFTVVLGY